MIYLVDVGEKVDKIFFKLIHNRIKECIGNFLDFIQLQVVIKGAK